MSLSVGVLYRCQQRFEIYSKANRESNLRCPSKGKGSKLNMKSRGVALNRCLLLDLMREKKKLQSLVKFRIMD